MRLRYDISDRDETEGAIAGRIADNLDEAVRAVKENMEKNYDERKITATTSVVEEALGIEARQEGLVFDASELPDEVSGYGFDQLDHRLFEDTVTEPFMVDLVFEGGMLTTRSVAEIALKNGIQSKLSDLEWEVKHDERDDWSIGAVRNMSTDEVEVDTIE